MNTGLQVIATFDFDGTITYKDTLLPFLIEIGGLPKALGNIALESPSLARFALGMMSRQKAKEAILSRYFQGMSIENIKALGKKFASGKLNSYVKPDALQRIKWHQSQGHRCILISASLDVYLSPWAIQNGFNDIITSRLETDNKGKATGRLIGENCWGPEKSRRLEELLGPRENYLLYVYGDSRGDKDILSMADYGFYRQMPKE